MNSPIICLSVPKDLLREIDKHIKSITAKGKRPNRSAFFQRLALQAVNKANS